jgi:hypothetical protein
MPDATKKISTSAVHYAVELAKAGMPVSNGSMITSPDAVAKFIEIVATKIESITK